MPQRHDSPVHAPIAPGTHALLDRVGAQAERGELTDSGDAVLPLGELSDPRFEGGV